MKCDTCGRKVDSREEQIEHVLTQHADKLTAHKQQELEQERKTLQNNADLPLQKIGVATAILILLSGAAYILISTGILDISTDTAPGTPANISTADEPLFGNPAAPATIVVFEDFECPACRQFHTQVVPRITTDFIDTGQANLVWKDFPLTYAADMHPWSDEAATALECVYQQDEAAFWAVATQVFNNQPRLSTDTVQNQIMTWARQYSVDTQTAATCTTDPATEQAVRNDFTEGRSIGVRGTPTVYVNGQQVDPTYQAVAAAIQAAQ